MSSGEPRPGCRPSLPSRQNRPNRPTAALEQIEAALAAGIPAGVVLADAGYGADMKFQARLAELGLQFIVGVQPRAKIWINGKQPLPPKAWSGQTRSGVGRPPSNLRRDANHQPIEARTWAMQLPPEAWQAITWREGTKGELVSRFTHTRIRPAHRDYWRSEPWPELTVLAEWPDGEAEPTKIWFANIHPGTPLEHLVHLAKLRWRIERDYLELKQELGLSHYEGRGWRGFHHHASLCIAAYGYLIKERLALSPSGNSRPGPKNVAPPKTYIPRGSPRKTREAYPKLHRHHARPHRHPLGSNLAAMSMLLAASGQRCLFMTQ
jgi:SRSO17 transposase